MNKIQVTIFIAIILIFGIVVVLTQSQNLGLNKKEEDQISLSQIPENINALPEQTDSQITQPPTNQIARASLEEFKVTSATATIKTNKGEITLALDGKAAPYTVANFIKKAKEGFYNNLTFHRVEDWVIQGGDPLGNGTGGGKMQTEINTKPFIKGSLGIARGMDLNVSNDSQFFITKTDSSHLNQQYTNFGEVTSGQDVVDKIAIGDKIESIEIK